MRPATCQAKISLYPYLSDPSPIIGYGYAWHSLTNWLTDSLAYYRLVNLIDVTLACKDADSELVEVVSVADDKRFDDSFMQIWKLKFGHKA